MEINIKPENISKAIFESRVIKRTEAILGDPYWWEYFWEVVKSNEASFLCGLPKRDYTEVIDDPKTGDKILRYIKSDLLLTLQKEGEKIKN